MEPQVLQVELLLTALTPISHHDPAQNDGSNTLTFNRQKQLVVRDLSSGHIEQAAVSALCTAQPVPSELAGLFADLSFSEYVAAVLVRELIDAYNSLEGTGLFAGMERYQMLETRLRAGAVRTHTLRGLWALVCRDMQFPVHGGDRDAALGQLFGLPRAVQERVIALLVEQARSVVSIARLWHATKKRQSEQYALAIGAAVADGVTILTFDPARLDDAQARAVVEVPAVSANSVRHQTLREPGWRHLARSLGFEAGPAGHGELGAGVEAIFANGGNIRAGAKQPSNAFALAQSVRERWPLLDLLGGVCDAFDLGESRVQVACWLVCRENAAALGARAARLPEAQVSAFDLLDDVTATRQAVRGEGQMIYNFETLVAGTRVLVRYSLSPYVTPLTVGAFWAACEEYARTNPTLAGQASRGFGHVRAEWLGTIDQGAARTYEAYLQEHREELRGWLLDGTLGTPARVLS